MSLQFLPLVVTFAKAWWPKGAIKEVERDSDTTEKLRNEQVSALKAEVSGLVHNADKHVAKFFSDDLGWWHLQKELSPRSNHRYFVDRSGCRTIEKALRLVLGKLGVVLANYGYASKSRFQWL